jgi:protoheme IX farnesyltransferase
MTALQQRALARQLGASAVAYAALTKPRIIELLLITTVPTMIVAQRGWPGTWLVAATVGGGALAAGAANAFNCALEADIDTVMERTSDRPLPNGRVTPARARRFAAGLAVLAVVGLAALVNPLAAGLAAFAILFYVVVYTLGLKRRTTQNIVIGGAAGCMPVVIGWAAVTGGIDVPALVLFGIVFAWTPPHFWALALRYREDYARAGVPMLPVVVGDQETAKHILLYGVLMVAVTLMFGPVGQMGAIYLVAALALGGWFLWHAAALWRHVTQQRAMRVFHASIAYLALLFVAMAVDAVALS